MNIFTLNAGSSSLKYGIYTITAERQECVASWDEPTLSNATDTGTAANQAAARVNGSGLSIDAVGHRIVFGGPKDEPTLVTPALLERLSGLTMYDPLHMPSALRYLAAAQTSFPSLPHVVCFDTAFFRDLPEIAKQLSIPTSGDPFFRRYGFHGLSYEYLQLALGKELQSRCIFAHLGSGASLAALRDGRPIDTTMGFSSMGGVLMATRPGDLDPGALLYLIQKDGLDEASLRSILEERSGLVAISGSEGSVRALLDRHGDGRADLAIAAFVRSIAKHIGALATVLRGVDQLVFTGGIGEHLAPIRTGIAQSIQHLGVELDENKNAADAEIISSEASSVDVRVIATDENMSIARHTYDIVQRGVAR